MNEIPFHERFFSTSEPPSQILYSARLAKTVVTSFFKSLISYVLRGTIHPEWTLTYHIANSVLRTIILANRGGPQSKSIPDFNHFQQRTLAMKPGKIKDVIISTESFSPDQSVIEFLKSNIPASCWPADRAQDTAVVIEADWISHKDARTEKVILHFHGGGYVQLSNKTHRKLSALISKLSTCRVFSINYRLAPQNPFPCSVIDAVSAYKHLLKSYNPGNIILMGDSAGGGLAIACAMVIRDLNLSQPAGIYAQSPWVDLTHIIAKRSLEENAKYDYIPGSPPDIRKGKRLHYYSPDELLRHPYVSPYWGSCHKLPPLFIHGGSGERLYDEIEAFAEKAVAQSDHPVIFDTFMHHVHVFPLFFSIDKACYKSLEIAGRWIQSIDNAIQPAPQSIFTTFNFRGEPITEKIYEENKLKYVHIMQ